MSEPTVASLSFDQARAQLEAGAAAILNGVPEAGRNALLPTLELRRGKTRAELAFKQLAPPDFFTLLGILGPYFKELRKLRNGYSSASFEADLYYDFTRRRAVEKKEELPAPLNVDFKWEQRKGNGTIAFEREGFLLQE